METNASVNDLLKEYWQYHGRDSLEALLSEKLAEKYSKEAESADSPLKVIRKAIKEAERDEIATQIPNYSCLSQYADFVDRVTRAFKTGGSEAALSVLDSDTASDHRTRSIKHAFYLALGVTTKSWKFTGEEKEYGKHLQNMAKGLMESTAADEHHERFVNFLREAGCSEEVKRA
jgi:hypothetical protein